MISMRICSGETTSSVGTGQGDQCWRCTKETGQVPWLVLRMTAWAFLTATMRTTNARGQWWGPVLRLPREVQEDEEALGNMEVSVGGGAGGEKDRGPDGLGHGEGAGGRG